MADQMTYNLKLQEVMTSNMGIMKVQETLLEERIRVSQTLI